MKAAVLSFVIDHGSIFQKDRFKKSKGYSVVQGAKGRCNAKKEKDKLIK